MVIFTALTHALVFGSSGFLDRQEMRKEIEQLDRQILQLSNENNIFSEQLNKKKKSEKIKNKTRKYDNAIILKFEQNESLDKIATDEDFIYTMVNRLNDIRQESSILYLILMTFITLIGSSLLRKERRNH